jgi:hypothetical protein
MKTTLDPTDFKKIRLMAFVAVASARVKGIADTEIPTKGLDEAKRAIEEFVEDPIEQETWWSELGRAVDAEIKRTRPKTGKRKPR